MRTAHLHAPATFGHIAQRHVPQRVGIGHLAEIQFARAGGDRFALLVELDHRGVRRGVDRGAISTPGTHAQLDRLARRDQRTVEGSLQTRILAPQADAQAPTHRLQPEAFVHAVAQAIAPAPGLG